MRAQEYLEEMKNLQKDLLCFIEGEDNIEEYFQNQLNILNKETIFADKYKFREFLHLLSNISNNHYRQKDFFSKIEQIILQYKDNITNNFSNFEIFNIFKENKRILLFLHEKNIMKINENLTKRLTSKKYLKKSYPLYFLPEIKPYIKKEWFSEDEIENNKLIKGLFDSINKELPENFYENRKKGENESYIKRAKKRGVDSINGGSIQKIITFN